jgi:very-short-patch-repair endonuclease
VTREDQRSTREGAITAIAACQHGVITRVQLLGAGVSTGMIARRLEAGQLRALHRGVYVMGPLTPPPAALMAAVLACGDAAMVSHYSAGRLWELLAARYAGNAVHVTVAGADHRRPGIRVHRVAAIAADEVTRRDGIPVTTPARTLIDLARMPWRDLERALAEALAKRLTTRDEMLTLLKRHERRQGASRLRALLESPYLAHTKSEAEERFVRLLEKGRLPAPEVNVRVAGYEVDCYWRSERFVVEIDGFAFHSSPKTFEKDRQRDAELAAAGIRVIRVTWQQLTKQPAAVLVRLAQALARTSPP